MRIGDLARHAQTQAETIRYYERVGLLPETARTEGNYRVYDNRHVERLSFIRYCRGLDMSLEEIRALLRFMDAPNENCAGVDAILKAHIGHVSRRVKELQSLKRRLQALRRACSAPRESRQCGILSEISASSQQPTIAPAEHVGGTHGIHGKTA
ncbi:MAG: Cd(II)/Pb(II)-responsive transcriptional regulator [Zoogloeaceae bacterium]|jgi:Cd(II)/Pb(II)-responsive transcriptional regulator|nr:Cd(II)/Pb(II)-responsive transcriptional regulator [Zoogloeaceae bacterium]